MRKSKNCPHCGDLAHTLECKPMLYAELARLQDELSTVRAQVGAMCLLTDYQEQRVRAERAEALLQECRDEWWLPPEMTARIDALLKKEVAS